MMVFDPEKCALWWPRDLGIVLTILCMLHGMALSHKGLSSDLATSSSSHISHLPHHHHYNHAHHLHHKHHRHHFISRRHIQHPSNNDRHQERCDKNDESPKILAHEPWIHGGKKSTVTLHCELCLSRQDLAPKKEREEQKDDLHDYFNGPEVWWMKDGKLLTRSTSRVRQMVHGENHFLLRIKNLRDSDFGTYTCGHNTTLALPVPRRSGVDQGQVTDKIEVSGVPYPAKFDDPTLWSDSIFKLVWRVNCSTPIINYQLEFREIPHGDWVTLNVPGDFGTLQSKYHNRFARQEQKVEEHVGEYTLKGLSSGMTYEARVRSRNEYGLSAQSKVISFHTFEPETKRTSLYEDYYGSRFKTIVEPNGDERLSQPSNVIQATFLPPYMSLEESKQPRNADDQSTANSQPLATTKDKKGYAAFSSGSRLTQELFQLTSTITILNIAVALIR